ncbi:MAG: DoxX family membrane protein [Microbacteriaceae bacterium]|nr:DoxX family membrane protein [Microbacteriaceae bacterium]
MTITSTTSLGRSTAVHLPPSAAPGLAVLRIALGVLWVQNAGWKVPPDFGREGDRGLSFWANQAVEYPVFAPYSSFVETVFLPQLAIVGWAVLLTEVALGTFLILGLATRAWAAVGIIQTIAIALSVLNAPDEWHWGYILMGVGHLVLLLAAAGRTWGIDGLLRPIWVQAPGRVSRLMSVLS